MKCPKNKKHTMIFSKIIDWGERVEYFCEDCMTIYDWYVDSETVEREGENVREDEIWELWENINGNLSLILDKSEFSLDTKDYIGMAEQLICEKRFPNDI